MQPLVSIIIPIYNAEKQIENCIKSIQKQSYPNIEIICVNDGSKDKTALILDGIAEKDSRVKVIHNKNQGVSATRNCGIENASGEYIQFVDSDDELYENATESLVSAIIEDNSDMVFFGYHRSDEIDIRVPLVGCYDTKSLINRFSEIYHGGVFNQPWNKLYKKTLITDNFNVEMSIAEDAVFNVQYIKNTKCVSFVDVVGYNYILGNPNSLSLKYNPLALESEKEKIIKINNLMSAYACEENISELNKLYENDFKRCIHHLIYASGKDIKTLEKEIVQWVYDDVWYEVLRKNRNIEKLDKNKVKSKVNYYIYRVLIIKKIGQMIRGKR